MITTVAVSPYARYGLPTVTTWPAAAERIAVYMGAATSMPLWNPPQRAPKPDVIGPESGHSGSFEPLNAPSPDFAAASAASCAYNASACSSFRFRLAVSSFARPAAEVALFFAV